MNITQKPRNDVLRQLFEIVTIHFQKRRFLGARSEFAFMLLSVQFARPHRSLGLSAQLCTTTVLLRLATFPMLRVACSGVSRFGEGCVVDMINLSVEHRDLRLVTKIGCAVFE